MALAATAVLAASLGKVRVEVRDEQGKALDAVRVVASVARMGQTFEATTDAQGEANFAALPGGEVILRFEKGGFQILEKNAKVQVGGTEVVSVQLMALAPAVADPAELERQKAKREAAERLNAASALYDAGDLDGARASLAVALERNPDVPQAHVLAGKIAVKRGEHGVAADAYIKALALDPSMTSLLPSLVTELERAGRKDEAKAYAARMDQQPATGASPNELYNRAIVKLNAGEDPAALAILEDLLKAHPGFGPAVYQRGMIRLREAKLDAAKSDMARYLELEPQGEFAADAREMLKMLDE
jgi:Tfp pilus assembly protein PilF